MTAEKSYLKGTAGGPASTLEVYSQSEMEALDNLTIQVTGNNTVFDCYTDYGLGLLHFMFIDVSFKKINGEIIFLKILLMIITRMIFQTINQHQNQNLILFLVILESKIGMIFLQHYSRLHCLNN